MKKHYYFFILSGLLLSLVSCLNKQEGKSISTSFPKIIQFDFNTVINDSLDLSFIAEKIEYIPLQTDDTILMEYFDNYVITDDRIFIQNKGLIRVFDSDGNYINNLFTRGRGPEESTLRCFAVDEDNRLVYVYGSNANTVKIYNYDGSYISEIRNFLPEGYRTFSIGIFDEAIFVQTSQRPGTEYLYSLYYPETDSVYILYPNYRQYLKSQQEKMPLSPYDYHYQLTDSLLLMKESYSDTIYKVTEDIKKEPYYIVNLGDNKLGWEHWRDNGMFVAYNRVGPPKGYKVQSFIEADNFLFFVLRSFIEPPLFAVYNKKSDKLRIITHKNIELPTDQIFLRNDLDDLLPFSPMNKNGYMTYKNNCLYSVIDAGEFAKAYKKKKLRRGNTEGHNKKMNSSLSEIDEFDNPVVLKLYLK
jgi:hypothetical protein